MVNALGEGHRERVAIQARLVLATLRRNRRERPRLALDRGRCLGAAEGLVNELADGRVIGAIRRGETPRSPMDDAEGEAAIRGPRHRLHRAVLDTHRLVLALDGARVRVTRAA